MKKYQWYDQHENLTGPAGETIEEAIYLLERIYRDYTIWKLNKIKRNK